MKWFAPLEEEMERGREEKYRLYLNQVISHRNTLDQLLEGISAATDLCNQLKQSYAFVEDKSRALQQACETLFNEQV